MQHHRWSRRVAFALPVLALAGAVPTAAQDFEGVFTSRVQGGTEIKGSIKAGKYRVDVTAPGQQAAVAIIADAAAGETYMVMPAQQMVMVMKMSEAEKMVQQKVGAGTDAKLTATGRKETVAGHQCEYYQFSDGTSTTDICFAMDLGGFRAGLSMFGAPGRGGPAAAPPWAKELLRKEAFPLKVVRQTGDVVWEVTSVERKKLDASLFAIPENYRRMEMPGRPPAR